MMRPSGPSAFRMFRCSSDRSRFVDRWTALDDVIGGVCASGSNGRDGRENDVTWLGVGSGWRWERGKGGEIWVDDEWLWL